MLFVLQEITFLDSRLKHAIYAWIMFSSRKNTTFLLKKWLKKKKKAFQFIMTYTIIIKSCGLFQEYWTIWTIILGVLPKKTNIYRTIFVIFALFIKKKKHRHTKKKKELHCKTNSSFVHSESKNWIWYSMAEMLFQYLKVKLIF